MYLRIDFVSTLFYVGIWSNGECENTDITHIADGLRYDTKCDINLPLYYWSKNSFYTFDYSTKDKIE